MQVPSPGFTSTLPHELQVFPFPSESSWRKEKEFFYVGKVRDITSWKKDRKREEASLFSPSLCGRETVQVAPRGSLTAEHSHWANSSPRQLLAS